MPGCPTVLFVIDFYSGAHGGTEGQLLELLRHLPEQGYEPRLVVLRDTAFTLNTRDFCCPLQTLGIRRLFSPVTLWKLVKFARQLRRERIRIVHIYFNDGSLVIPLFAWLAGSKVIVSRRDMGIWYTRTNLPVLRLVGRFVDRVIANSQAVARAVAAAEWLPSCRTRVVYNGYVFDRERAPAQADFRARHGIGDTDSIIGIVANLTAVKRHADLVNAFVEVRQQHQCAHLVLVGMGPLHDALLQEVGAKGLTGCVHFLGTLSDVIPVIQHFTVGVLCSESEGFSNALIEYMACGIPIVCTRAGGNVELVDDDVNGFLVDVGDSVAIANRISRLLTDRALAGRLGQAARQRASQYTLSRMLDGTVEIYREVLAAEASA